MNGFPLSWIEVAIVSMLLSACLAYLTSSPERAHRVAIVGSAIGVLASAGAWLHLLLAVEVTAGTSFHAFPMLFGIDAFGLDGLNAPLLPLIALIYFVTILSTMRRTRHRFSFSRTLVSEAALLAMFSAKSPWVLIGLLVVSVIPPALELRALGRSSRVYTIHMSAFILCLVVGWSLASSTGAESSVVGFALIAIAVAIRSGLVPMHCWVTDYFENGAFGTALLSMAPLTGAYIALRLLLSAGAPPWLLHDLAFVALTTAVYTAAMSLVTRSGRRFFSYILLNQSALVIAGLALGTSLSLTGALCLWTSVGLGMTGLGLTLRSIEGRTGRVSLVGFQGLHTQTPTLAAFFLLTGLAAVGFPGTIGFFGAEMLLDSADRVGAALGVAVVVSGALIGISVVRAYAIVFLGARHAGTVNLTCRPSERLAVLSLTLLLLGGVLWPQPWISSQARAADKVLTERARMTDGVTGGVTSGAEKGGR